MSQPTHPLLSLVECHKNGLKSMLTHYIDATVDSQFASLRNSILNMIQSGQIGPQYSENALPYTQANCPTGHSNIEPENSSILYHPNDQLTNTEDYQNTLHKEVSMSNTNITESMIKQEFEDDEKEMNEEGDENGREIEDDVVVKCENCVKGICTSGNDAEMGKNRDKSSDTTQLNVQVALENNQTNESIISNGQQVINAIDDTTENIELQVNDQSDHLQNVHRRKSSDLSVIESSTSGIRSSTRKRIQTKVFGDDQLYVNSHKKQKSVKSMDDGQYNSDESMVIHQEERDANNAIGEEMATECTTNPTQANRNLQCSHCLKSCVSISKLQTHLRVHTGERPFQCDQCDKRFSQVGHLTAHQLIHQNIKRYRCDECEKKFTLKHHLHDHLLIHSGERPFECRHCEKSFAKLDTRNKHEQSIHLHVKPYQCKQCGHTATHRTHLIQHIRFVHFGLPKTIKEQRALNIIDDRDPSELVEKV